MFLNTIFESLFKNHSSVVQPDGPMMFVTCASCCSRESCCTGSSHAVNFILRLTLPVLWGHVILRLFSGIVLTSMTDYWFLGNRGIIRCLFSCKFHLITPLKVTSFDCFLWNFFKFTLDVFYRSFSSYSSKFWCCCCPSWKQIRWNLLTTDTGIFPCSTH